MTHSLQLLRSRNVMHRNYERILNFNIRDFNILNDSNFSLQRKTRHFKFRATLCLYLIIICSQYLSHDFGQKRFMPVIDVQKLGNSSFENSCTTSSWKGACATYSCKIDPDDLFNSIDNPSCPSILPAIQSRSSVSNRVLCRQKSKPST
jgi:hypothetical protein